VLESLLLEVDNLSLASMVMLAHTVVVALVGGLAPAVATAIIAGVMLNYLFIPPTGTLTIAQPSNAAALLVMIGVAIAVSLVVTNSARRTAEAAQARAEADTLTLFAGSVLRGEDDLTTMLDRVRVTFQLRAAALLQRDTTLSAWQPLASSGEPVPTDDDEGTGFPIDDHTTLVVTGRDLSTSESRVLSVLAAQFGTLLERRRLRDQAASARLEKARGGIRSAILAALSHDLRSPLAGIKASVGALRTPGLPLPDEDRAELLAGIEDSADRLQGLIDNLLDLTRLDAGALVLRTSAVALDEVVPRALDSIGTTTGQIEVDVRPTLPLVRGDAGLIERIVANLVENALRHAGTDDPIRVTAGTIRDRVVLRVIDRGPGVPAGRIDQIFEPFQRLNDVPAGQGVGLGLAVARGFAEANGGTLEAEETPGGGLTMVLTLPVEPDQDGADQDGAEPDDRVEPEPTADVTAGAPTGTGGPG
jgi:two-component system sensor histidine kinase KdpD